MKFADIIIPHGKENTTAIDFVVNNLKTKVPTNLLEFERTEEHNAYDSIDYSDGFPSNPMSEKRLSKVL